MKSADSFITKKKKWETWVSSSRIHLNVGEGVEGGGKNHSRAVLTNFGLLPLLCIPCNRKV